MASKGLSEGSRPLTIVNNAAADSFIQRLPKDTRFFLVHGADEGLAHERVKAIVGGLIDASDPLRLTRLEGDAVARDPGGLADEAYAISMFGGSRAIWIDAQTRDLLPALTPLFGRPPADCAIVVKAGLLKKGAALRAAFEKVPNAAAIECYSDAASSLEALIRAESRAAGVEFAPDARTALLALLGADRQTTRNEIAKLLLFARGKAKIELEDVEAIVSDAAPSSLDELVDHALLGDRVHVEAAAARYFQDNGDADFLMIRLVASAHASASAAAGNGSGPVFRRRLRNAVRQIAGFRTPRAWETGRAAGPRNSLHGGCREYAPQARGSGAIRVSRPSWPRAALWALASGNPRRRATRLRHRPSERARRLGVTGPRADRGGGRIRRAGRNSRRLMRSSPLSPAWRIVTFAPSARASLSSSARVSASTVEPAFAAFLFLRNSHRTARHRGRSCPLRRCGRRARRARQPRAGRGRAPPKSVRPPAASACVRKLGETQRVGDMAAALADNARDVGVRIAVVRGELRIAGRLFKRVEIGALHIFDDRDFERLAIARLDNDNRQFVQSGELSRPPPALARDDLVGVGRPSDRANDNRLDDPAFPDRSRELVEFSFGKSLANVAGIRAKELDRRRCAPRGGSAASPFGAPSKAARPRPRRGRSARATSSAMILVLPVVSSKRGLQAARHRPSRWMTSEASLR